MRRFLLLLVGLLCALSAYAHKPSDSYLTLNVQGSTIAGQWDIALRDLDFAPQHKGLLRLQYQGASWTGIFSAENAFQQFSLSQPSKLSQFLD